LKSYQILITIVLLFGAVSAQSPLQTSSKDNWSEWDFLLGEWTAAGSSGEPGSASKGSFTLAPDLGGKVLVRKNHAEYPPANGRPAIVHDDLMIVYHESGAVRAFYDDNEGHVIHYDVSFPDRNHIVFLSEKLAGATRYRLSYENVKEGTVNLKFEIAPPDHPEQFKTYVAAVVHRKS
jgi:hypothetical protein